MFIPVPLSQGELADDCERLKQENAQQEIQIAELEYVCDYQHTWWSEIYLQCMDSIYVCIFMEQVRCLSNTFDCLHTMTSVKPRLAVCMAEICYWPKCTSFLYYVCSWTPLFPAPFSTDCRHMRAQEEEVVAKVCVLVCVRCSPKNGCMIDAQLV